MKKIIFSLTLLLFVAHVFSQIPTDTTYSKDYYLKKNKNEKIFGWIMAGGGLGAVIAGVSTFKIHYNISFSGRPSQDNQDNNSSSITLIVTGLGAMLGSIPVFVSAHHNKKKAASLAISNQNIFLPRQNNFASMAQPTLALKIGL